MPKIHPGSVFVGVVAACVGMLLGLLLVSTLLGIR
jgi:hypothetical protein